MHTIPVVLFVYRRPDILQQVLHCLQADGVPLLHIFSDGPKDTRGMAEVAAVRQLIHAIDWCDCVIEERASNLGLGISVKRGVSAALQRYRRAIIFEDDLLCIPGTYHYLSCALDRYEDDPEVMSVTA